MNIFQKLLSLFKPNTTSGSRFLQIYLLSRRCNEPLVGQVDLMNELSQTEDSEHTYFVRKVLHTTGRNRCFDQVEVQLWFDGNRNLAQHEEFGGRWLTAEEYEQELIRFNTPADESVSSEEAEEEKAQ